MFAPSKAKLKGFVPTENVPSRAPSLARNFFTVLSLPFTSQMLLPSKATWMGTFPTGNEAASFAVYQCKSAILFGLFWPTSTAGINRASTAKEEKYFEIEFLGTRVAINILPLWFVLLQR